ncbi:MAG: prepilin-type N-terminal cleavage/methylation domain-containing protein [Betaproteobacteria bacterium]|nr:prepilin-type N-terminal cleavage/methylation domain-containing protein [Betaproteobacteria bacterium]MDH3437596.1 prepilin-type N-terminal cleavage/methylation domain-containing protein [Betaproteobacteria bacterium]
MLKPVNPRLPQRGATLLEAMVGILIFSLGILALVGMQALAVKRVNDAKYRADASFYANQIVGEMWVNRTNLATYAYAGSGAPPAAIANWVTSIQSALPGVTAAANRPTVTVVGTTVTVTVFWQPPASSTVHNHITMAYING